jgi:hypothetical protein
MMYKVLAAAGVGVGLLLAVPASSQALPSPASGIKADSAIQQVGYEHRRWYKHRHWKRGHHHHNHYRYYRKRKGIHIHVH